MVQDLFVHGIKTVLLLIAMVVYIQRNFRADMYKINILDNLHAQYKQTKKCFLTNGIYLELVRNMIYSKFNRK